MISWFFYKYSEADEDYRIYTYIYSLLDNSSKSMCGTYFIYIHGGKQRKTWHTYILGKRIKIDFHSENIY